MIQEPFKIYYKGLGRLKTRQAKDFFCHVKAGPFIFFIRIKGGHLDFLLLKPQKYNLPTNQTALMKTSTDKNCKKSTDKNCKKSTDCSTD